MKKCVLREDLNESVDGDDLTSSGSEFQTLGAVKEYEDFVDVR